MHQSVFVGTVVLTEEKFFFPMQKNVAAAPRWKDIWKHWQTKANPTTPISFLTSLRSEYLALERKALFREMLDREYRTEAGR